MPSVSYLKALIPNTITWFVEYKVGSYLVEGYDMYWQWRREFTRWLYTQSGQWSASDALDSRAQGNVDSFSILTFKIAKILLSVVKFAFVVRGCFKYLQAIQARDPDLHRDRHWRGAFNMYPISLLVSTCSARPSFHHEADKPCRYLIWIGEHRLQCPFNPHHPIRANDVAVL